MPRATAEKIEETSLDEFPVAHVLTRVVIKALCPFLNSEIMFGEFETLETPERFEYWTHQKLSGDLEAEVGIGADRHLLRTLALNFNKKNNDNSPDIRGVLMEMNALLTTELENQFNEEEFRCLREAGPEVNQDFTLLPPGKPFVLCSVETKFGFLKVYFCVAPAFMDIINELQASAADQRKIRVYASQLENLSSHVKQLEQLESRLLEGPQIRSQMRTELKKLKRMVSHLKSEPLEMLFTPARRIGVDIAKQLGKQITVSTHGTRLALDKSLMNNLYEPIIQLIRNAVDHGIEDPKERKKRGKPPIGHIKCLVAFTANGLRMIVSDDGRGLDFEKIRQRAIAQGLLKDEKGLPGVSEVLSSFIFEPGFTTLDQAAANKGLGLDIVKKGVERLGGSVKVLSTSDHGTSIEICVPLKDALRRSK